MKKRKKSYQEAKCDVFISYRRDGGEMTALYISQELKRRGYRVFYDRENLRAPVRFNERLLDSIRSCTDFVLILSPHALDRCVNEDDWVRTELEEALKAGKNIVPVAMSGFEYPANLPDSIAEVRYIQAMTPSMDFFTESMNRLCDDFLMTRLHVAGKRTLPLIAVGALALLAVAAAVFAGSFLRRAPAPEPTPAPIAEETPEPTPELTAEPTPEPTPEPGSPISVLGGLQARMQLALYAGRDDNVLELLGDSATLDMGDFTWGFAFIAPVLEIANPTGEDVSFSLQRYIDGEEQCGAQETCPAGETRLYGFDTQQCDPSRYMTPGRHAASYVMDGKELISFDYELTDGKRADPRDDLLVSPMMSVYDAQGNFLRFERGNVVNPRLAEGDVLYGSAIEITNLGEDRQFHLCAYSMDETSWHCEPEPVCIAHGETLRFAAFPLPKNADNWRVFWAADGYFLSGYDDSYSIVDEDPNIALDQIENLESYLALIAPDGGDLEKWWNNSAPQSKAEFPEGSLYMEEVCFQNMGGQDVVFSLSGSLDGRNWERIWKRLSPGEVIDCLLGLDVAEQAQTVGRHMLTYRINNGEMHSFEYELTDEPRIDPRDRLRVQACLSVLDAEGTTVDTLPGSQADLSLLPEEGGYFSPTVSLQYEGGDLRAYIVQTDENGRTRLEGNDICDDIFLLSGEETVFDASLMRLDRPWSRDLVWYVNGYPVLEETYTITDNGH